MIGFSTVLQNSSIDSCAEISSNCSPLSGSSKGAAPLQTQRASANSMCPWHGANYPVFGLFDGRVYSHEARLMKPDPKIFTHTIETLDLDPANTIYIDDKPENIAAGIAAGFTSITYDMNKHEAFLREVLPHL